MDSLLTIFKWAFLLPSGLAATAIALLYTFQDRLLYPSFAPAGSREKYLNVPPWLKPRNVFTVDINTPDGETLKGFLLLHTYHTMKPQSVVLAQELYKVPLPQDNASPDRPYSYSRPTIVFFHGNAGNYSHRYQNMATLFLEHGCNVLIFDYRGYGLSTGFPSEKGLLIDGQAVLDFLLKWPVTKPKNAHVHAIDPNKIILFGRSLGGAVAISVAEKNSTKVLATIIENSFSNIPDLVPSFLKLVLPQRAHFLIHPTLIKAFCRLQWYSSKRIPLVAKNHPILFLSGRIDEIVPPASMDALMNVAKKSFEQAHTKCQTTQIKLPLHLKSGVPQLSVFEPLKNSFVTPTPIPCEYTPQFTPFILIGEFPQGYHNETWLCSGYNAVISIFLKRLGLQTLPKVATHSHNWT